MVILRVKKGDTVKMLSGKDRAKTGKILRIFTKERKAIVEELNLVKKAVRARKQGQKGQIISKPRPVDISKLMLICPTCRKPTRVGFIFENNPSSGAKLTAGRGSKVRVCKKCGSAGF